MTPGGADDIRFLLSDCERRTLVGVIAPGMLPILVIGLLDYVGGPLRCSDWLVVVAILSSNEHARGRCRLPRGSQDRVYKAHAGRELFT